MVKYFKVLPKDLLFNGYQYKLGLNTDIKTRSDSFESSYFLKSMYVNLSDIYNYFEAGINELVIVDITCDKDTIIQLEDNKCIADCITILSIHSLNDPDTVQWLNDNHLRLFKSTEYNHRMIDKYDNFIKFCIDNDSNKEMVNDKILLSILIKSLDKNKFDMVKFILNNNLNLINDNDFIDSVAFMIGNDVNDNNIDIILFLLSHECKIIENLKMLDVGRVFKTNAICYNNKELINILIENGFIHDSEIIYKDSLNGNYKFKFSKYSIYYELSKSHPNINNIRKILREDNSIIKCMHCNILNIVNYKLEYREWDQCHNDVFKYLIEYGFNIFTNCTGKYSIAYYLFKYSDQTADLIKFIVDNFEYLYNDTLYIDSAFRMSCNFHVEYAVESLLKFNPSIKYKSCYTGFLDACKNGNIKIIKYFIDNNIDINDEACRKPLLESINNNEINSEIMRILYDTELNMGDED